ncbi:VCBS repeat-containing protein [Maribacter confluentis]|uniref:VCBS repeat-containing protein n=1 Tax=Maribacter confluentis TaxID=1656093 RepID=A0ABT8RKT3_9FLAO|nr:VCBS repeat-containing protein [Maribacter confluentis]MDO1511567.1 VCBS repeat-containing protein [Maribacter confluentis]
MKKIILLMFFISVYVNGQQARLFDYVPARQSNVDFNNKLKPTDNENFFIYDNFYQGAGVGLGDVNNDGLLDIYFCGNQEKDRLYLNKGNFVFEDITKKSGILAVDKGWSSSVSMIDINNDGLLDIYVTKELYDDRPDWRRNKLYINKGNSTFVEAAQKVGLGDTTRTRGAAFLDYDLDGDLDAFLLRQPPNPGLYSKYKVMSDNGELTDEQYAPQLYENRNGIFYNVSKEAKVLSPSYANAVTVGDINKDGYPDIVVANDFDAPDALYINQGDKTFKNVSNKAFKHTSYYAMGVDIADINNDMLLDIFTVDMAANDNFRLKSNMSGMNPDQFWKIVDKGWNYQYMYNALQLNNGNCTFSEIGQLSGVSSTDWSWSPLIADFDNDGYKDIFVSNGIVRDIRNTDADVKIKLYINKKLQEYVGKHGNADYNSLWDVVDHNEMVALFPSTKMQNKSFKNVDGYQFQDVSENWGIDKKTFSSGAAYGDLDNDGDLDMVLNNVNEIAHILRNNTNNNFLRIQLSDPKNEVVLGANVQIYYGDGKQQYAETTSARGMFSVSEPVIHFGLGNHARVDSLFVNWPTGLRTEIYDPVINQQIDVSITSGKEKVISSSFEVPKMFSEHTGGSLKFKHKENRFNDYALQVLLPHTMSEFGPALAVADINNDGLDDVFIGGAFGEKAMLYMQDKTGSYKSIAERLWEGEKNYEDVDAVFVDINGDGFKDLFVVSGGNAYVKNDIHYMDRLYLNDGKGNFNKGALLNGKPISGSVVKVMDYDKDGDMDVFVGGRHIPHQYPLPSSSMLFVNEKGQLINKTDELAPEFNEVGMVTDAIWADYDADGDTDLFLVGEWMPITLFSNTDGTLSKAMVNDFETTAGWWYSVQQGDFDNDGDIDLIAGNLGLNNKYKTTNETPFDVYYDDFDGNGSSDIVLGYYNNDKHFPLRGFSCSSQQIPSLKEEFKKYDLFASLEIDQVYGKDNLEEALHYITDTFASIYIENLGNGRFQHSPLPVQAQFSNIEDMVVHDFNNDGNLDVLVVGNCYGFEVETPRNDAGTGLLMLGNGNGSFAAKTINETGLFINKDAKRIRQLKGKDSDYFIIGNNNDEIQLIKINTD